MYLPSSGSPPSPPESGLPRQNPSFFLTVTHPFSATCTVSVPLVRHGCTLSVQPTLATDTLSQCSQKQATKRRANSVVSCLLPFFASLPLSPPLSLSPSLSLSLSPSPLSHSLSPSFSLSLSLSCLRLPALRQCFAHTLGARHSPSQCHSEAKHWSLRRSRYQS